MAVAARTSRPPGNTNAVWKAAAASAARAAQTDASSTDADDAGRVLGLAWMTQGAHRKAVAVAAATKVAILGTMGTLQIEK